MDKNLKTISSYEHGVEEYISHANQTQSVRDYSWLRSGLAGVPTDAEIFEIGTGVGYEANEIESMGYRVHRSDAALSFIDYLASTGKQAIRFNVAADNFQKKHDVILANMVLLHFDKEVFLTVLQKICSALKVNGRLLFTMRSGDGDEWKQKDGGERYFSYWQPNDLKKAVENEGFLVKQIDMVLSDKADMIAVCAVKEAVK